MPGIFSFEANRRGGDDENEQRCYFWLIWWAHVEQSAGNGLASPRVYVNVTEFSRIIIIID